MFCWSNVSPPAVVNSGMHVTSTNRPPSGLRACLQHDGQLLRRLLVRPAVLQPQLKGSELLAAGMEGGTTSRKGGLSSQGKLTLMHMQGKQKRWAVTEPHTGQVQGATSDASALPLPPAADLKKGEGWYSLLPSPLSRSGSCTAQGAREEGLSVQ